MIIKSLKKKTRSGEKILLVQCDFKSSKNCKNIYEKLAKNVVKTRAFTNGKDRCINCFNFTKRGNNNYNYKHKKNENFFETIDCELKAYLLGIIAGDGTIKKEGFKIEIHKVDIQILQLLVAAINTDITPFKRKDARGKNTMLLDVNSTKMKEDICKHLKLSGHGKKSYKISLPDISEELLIHFIRGLFDSDGSITSIASKETFPICNYASMSLIIRKQVKDFSEKYDIPAVLGKTSITWNGINCMKFLNLLYMNANYKLIRKHAMFRLWETWVPFYGTVIKPKKKWREKFDKILCP